MSHRIEETIARGICIGCGVCSVATGGAVRLERTRTGLYRADVSAADETARRRASSVCPFSDESRDEATLGAPHPPADLAHHELLGSFRRVRMGRYDSSEFLLGSSSGGLVTWLLESLLTSRQVTAVVHVGAVDSASDELLACVVSTTVEELRARRKSQYYATTLAEVLNELRSSHHRVAIVGVPCFIRAARLLAAQDPTFEGLFCFYVGLVCGHLKSPLFAESLAWQVGVHPDELASVDFRIKVPSRSASEYDFGARRRGDATLHVARSSQLVGGNWGHGAMQPEACNFCDDIFAETADITFGDAWLPTYAEEWRGTNVVVSRNKELDRMMDEGAKTGELVLVESDAEAAAASQAGGYRHRRQGLAVRLADDLRAGLSVPRKRVEPGYQGLPRRRLRLIRQRRRISERSQSAFLEAKASNSLEHYLRVFRVEVVRYQRAEASWLRRGLWHFWSWLQSVRANVVMRRHG